MSERPREDQEPAASLEEGLFVLAFWTLVWGPLVAVVFLQVNKTFLLITPIVLLSVLSRGKLKQAFLTRRPLIVVLAAFFAGYCWYGYLEQNSQAFKARAAALDACSKLKSCVDRVQLDGIQIGAVAR